MKKVFLTVLSVCTIYFAIAQTKTTSVKGQLELRQIIKTLAAEETERGQFLAHIGLYKVQSGTLKEIDSLKLPATATSFSFSFSPSYKGYYAIGIIRYYENDNAKALSMAKMNQQVFRFYAKGGELVNMQIDSSNLCQMKDGNTKENQLLAAWAEILRPAQTVIYANKKFSEVYPIFTSLDSTSKIWLKGASSGNPAFDQFFKKTVAYDIAYAACRYVGNPRRQDALWEKSISDFTGYISSTNFSALMQDTFLLQLPNGYTAMGSMINTIGRLNYMRGDSARNIDYLAKSLSFIPNKTLKAYYAADYSRYLNNYDKLEAVADKYGKDMTPAQKKMIADHLTELAAFKKGTQGFNFSYADVNGNKVSFDDLKGKVVLVDVWATWCGPCRAELPHLKALEESYHDNDKIAFIGLSVDENNSEDAWKKFVAANDLKGIQIRAENGMSSKISQVYKINAIPRFMVFDKQGKVVTIDSPRPSDPKLKELLEETLKK